jgi:Putative prokaryotic signal transducing protein
MIDPEFDLETLVTVGAYASPWEAQLARACLEAEGVDSVVADEHLGRIWCATTVGGIKLRVREEDASRAAELLRSRTPIPELYLVTESDLPAAQRCPSCNSDNLVLERWSVLGFLGTWLLLGMALPVPRRRWNCRGCYSVWKDDDLGFEQSEELADLPELVTVGRFTTPWEAHLARMLLESEGIDACVLEERLPPVNLLTGLLTGEVLALNRLEVNEEDAPRALSLLAEIRAMQAASGGAPATD